MPVLLPRSRHLDDELDERGLTLIELLVSLLVLGVVMAGVAAVTNSTLRVTSINDARSVATNLAQAEIERLRATPFEDLQIGGQVEREVVVDSAVFDVRRAMTWVGLDADTDPCAEPGTSVDRALVRVDVEVARRDAPQHTVTTSSTIARPPVTPSPNLGALSVKVVDHAAPPAPVGSVRVRVTGPRPASGQVRVQHTPSTGCVLFVDLPPGNYEVDLDRSGHVSLAGDQAPVQSVGVTDGVRSALELHYAPAGAIGIEAAPRIEGSTAAMPVDLPVTLFRDGRVTHTMRGAQIASVFPGPIELWAGDCESADPLGAREEAFWPNAARQERVAVPAADATTAVADLAVVRVDVPPTVTNPAQPASVTVQALAQNACDSGTGRLTYEQVPVLSDAAGNPAIEIAMPYGHWHLRLIGPTGVSAVRYALADPRDPGIVVAEPEPAVWP